MKLDRTLPRVWVLHGRDVPALHDTRSRHREVVVEDVELLCASIVVDVSRCGAPYCPTELCDLYDALGFLLGRVVEVLPRYDPTRGRRVHDPWTAGFRAWLHDELLRDLHDQWRSWYGRKGQKRMPALHAFGSDEKGTDDERFRQLLDGNDFLTGRRRRSGSAPDEAAGDRGDSGLDVLRRRFLEGGDRALLREVEALGLRPDPGARGRAARTDRRSAARGVKEAA